jgi:hypothetical protein
MSKLSDKRFTAKETSQTIHDTIKFLAGDQRRASRSKRSLEKHRKLDTAGRSGHYTPVRLLVYRRCEVPAGVPPASGRGL